jgi:hypothetical protein
LKKFSSRHFGTSDYWEILGQKLVAQNNRCAISGMRIAIGTDASLDHIVPIANEGSKTIENVHWVHLWVNKMKYTTPLEDFIVDFENFIKQTSEFRRLVG